MAYRTYVGTTGKDSIQILGNNESFGPLFTELTRQGIKIDEDGCYEGKINEIQPIIDILEEFIWDKDKSFAKFHNSDGSNVDIFNLRPKKGDYMDFTTKMIDLQQNAYIFVVANLINYLRENLDDDYDLENDKIIYKIKEGKEVWFEAY